MNKPNYFWRVLIITDQLANTVLGGEPGETISARLATWSHRTDRGARRRAGSFFCGFLEAVDPGHCNRTADAVTRSEPTKPLMEYPYHGLNTHDPFETD